MIPLRLLVYYMLASCTADSHNCAISTDGHVDCSSRGYRTIPEDIRRSQNVTFLNMYGNNIERLGHDAFTNFSKLVNLNLSTTGIGYLNELAFRGLDDLRILDLTNNPVLGYQTRLPVTLFEHCPQITHLYISGQPLRGTFFIPLKNLTKIRITPNSEFLPYELANLPVLRILDFAFCEINNSLTKDTMLSFAKAALEEISFHGCDLNDIENNTFDNFHSLRLLNFAGNIRLNVNNVFETISVSKDLAVEDLILDLVGSELSSLFMLGPDPHGQCYEGGKSLKNLSLRGIKLIGLHENVMNCFPNLESFSAGFTAPYFLNGVQEGHFSTNINIRYIDVSYLMMLDPHALKYFIGFYKEKSWIPSNKSYFPRRMKEWNITNCFIPRNDSNSLEKRKGTMCEHHLEIPVCSTYVKADHIAYLGNFKPNACAFLSHNNIRYINISYPLRHKERDLSGMALYGLSYLEIADVSGIGLTAFNLSIFTEVPNIKEIYARNNELSGVSSISKLPLLPNLEVLDLSDNGIYQLRKDMFEFTTKINKLYVAKNYLRSLDFLHRKMNHLEYVDVSSNKILNIAPQTIDVLDHLHPNLTLDLTNNPLQCNCDNLDMVKWVQQTTIVLINKHALYCHDSQFTGLIRTLDLNNMRIKCAYTIILVTSLTSGIAIIMLTVFILLYRYRWSIRWYYYKAKFYRKHHHNEDYLLQGLNDETFSAFIIYAIDDDSIRPWVVDTLRKQIEVDWDKGSCFLRGRDDIPGHWDGDNIMYGLMKSKTALWVISPGFLEDKWCDYASNFALMHLGSGNNAYLIMEERFEEYSQPKKFNRLITHTKNAYVMKYTGNLNGRNLFWAKLEQFFHF